MGVRSLSSILAAVFILTMLGAGQDTASAAESKSATASEKAEENGLAAKKAFLKARTLFRAEEYQFALPLFRKAYELSGKKPSAIMGLAQCERMLKMYDEAVRHFEEYLATKPSQSIQARVRHTLKILETQREQAKLQLAEEARGQAEAAKLQEERRSREAEMLAETLAKKMAIKTVAPKPSVWSNPWVWVGVTVLVTGASIGTGFLLSASDDVYGGTTGTIFGKD